MITDNNYATSTADPEIAEKSKPAKIFDQEAYRAEQAEKENAALVGTGDGNMSVGEADASGEDTAAPEQGAAAEAKAVTEQGTAAEAKAVTGQEAPVEPEAAAEDSSVPAEAKAAAEDSSMSAEETVLPAAETTVLDEPVEEAGGYAA